MRMCARVLATRNVCVRVYECVRVCIIDRVTRNGRAYFYLVKWAGYDASSMSWIQQVDMLNARKLVKHYDDANPRPKLQ